MYVSAPSCVGCSRASVCIVCIVILLYYLNIHVYINIYIPKYICINIVKICMCKYITLYVYVQSCYPTVLLAYTYIYIYERINIFVYIYACIHICTYTFVYVYLCMYVPTHTLTLCLTHTRARAHIHTLTHTHAHIHTHTSTQAHNLSSSCYIIRIHDTCTFTHTGRNCQDCTRMECHFTGLCTGMLVYESS